MPVEKNQNTKKRKRVILAAAVAVTVSLFVIIAALSYYASTPAWLIVERIEEPASSEGSTTIVLIDEALLSENPKLQEAMSMSDDLQKQYPTISTPAMVMVTNSEGNRMLQSLMTGLGNSNDDKGAGTNNPLISQRSHEFIIRNDGKFYHLRIVFQYERPITW